MKDYQQRVVEESNNLNSKIQRLSAFFETDTFKVLEDEDKGLLFEQQEYMENYRSVLKKRIVRFG